MYLKLQTCIKSFLKPLYINYNATHKLNTYFLFIWNYESTKASIQVLIVKCYVFFLSRMPYVMWQAYVPMG